MKNAEQRVRFFDIARGFAIIAANPDKALDVALEVDNDTITVIESNLHNIARVLNGDPMAKEIEAVLTRPAIASPPLAPVVVVTAQEARREALRAERVRRDPDAFVWRPIVRENAPLGEKFAGFECRWKGLVLAITKHGPGKYEGTINGKHFAESKFKKNLRERLEKEATKRANA
jgi:hypothetical protein